MSGETIQYPKWAPYDLQKFGGRMDQVFVSNLYAAITHITEVLLNLRDHPLEVLVDDSSGSSGLAGILDAVDHSAGKIFKFEKEYFSQSRITDDEVIKRIVSHWCPETKGIYFEVPVDEMTTNPHYGTAENFYPHFQGQ